MNDKTKKAVGFLGTGSLFMAAGIATLITGGIPVWLAGIFGAVGLIANVFGITISAKPS